MRRFTGFQRGIVVVFLLGFLGVVGYQFLLSRSMRTDQATLRHLDEEVMQSPEMVSLTEKIERDRLLVKALQKDDVAAVARFFAEGVTSRDKVASQPLTMQAATHGAEKVMAFLIAQGADINAPGAQGMTPLMEAIKEKRPAVVEVLLNHGAEVNATDYKARTALMYAGHVWRQDYITTWTHNGKVFHSSNERQAPPDWKEEAARQALLPLLARGAKVNAVDSEGNTALSYAARYAQLPVVNILLDHGGDPTDALPYAAGSGNVTLLQRLLAKGAQVNKRWQRGETTLTYAKQAEKMHADSKSPNHPNYSRVVQLLLKAGAKE